MERLECRNVPNVAFLLLPSFMRHFAEDHDVLLESMSFETDALCDVQDWQNFVAPAAGGISPVNNPNIVVGAPSIVVAPKQQLQLQQDLRQHSFCCALRVATDLHAEVRMHAVPTCVEPRFRLVRGPCVLYPCMTD